MPMMVSGGSRSIRRRGYYGGGGGVEFPPDFRHHVRREGRRRSPVDARRWLSDVGTGVKGAFVENRSILSFEEYLQAFLEAPRLHARSSAQYLRDVLDHFGSEERDTPVGRVRRWHAFDLAFDPDGRAHRVAGQEDVQAALYRALGTFVRSGRVDKLVLLHGPNGSAKSSLVGALVRAMEAYSRTREGALYRHHWVFPAERKLRGGGLGFGPREAGGEVASFAHLDGDHLDARLSCPVKDHPLLLVPKEERRRLLVERCRPAARDGGGEGDFVVSEYLLEGEPCPLCRQVHDALLAAYRGDWLKVLRHVQVERFYASARYQEAAVTVDIVSAGTSTLIVRATTGMTDLYRANFAGSMPTVKVE